MTKAAWMFASIVILGCGWQAAPAQDLEMVKDPVVTVDGHQQSLSALFVTDEGYLVPVGAAVKLFTNGHGSFERAGEEGEITIDGRLIVKMPVEENVGHVLSYKAKIIAADGSILRTEDLDDIPRPIKGPDSRVLAMDAQTLGALLGDTVRTVEGGIEVYTPRYWAEQLLPTDAANQLDQFHVELVPDFGVSPPADKLLLWVRPQSAAYVQIYALSGQAINPLLGIDLATGKRETGDIPANAAKLWQASPEDPARAITQRDRTFESSDEAQYIALVCKSNPGEDPVDAIEDKRLKPGEWIAVGLVQKIGDSPVSFDNEKVKQGETPETIAGAHNMDADLFKKLNGIGENDRLSPGQEVIVMGDEFKTIPTMSGYSEDGLYCIRTGDSRAKLAERWGVKESMLIDANPWLADGAELQPGDLMEKISPARGPAQPSKDYMATGLGYAHEQVTLWQSTDTSGPNAISVGTIPAHHSVDIQDFGNDEFYRVEYGSMIGYARRSDLEVPQALTAVDNRNMSPVINTALKYYGLRYVWGGSSLKTGVDCSNFVAQVFKQAKEACPPAPVTTQENYGEIRQVKPGIDWAWRGHGDLPNLVGYCRDFSQLRPGARIIIQYANDNAGKHRHTGIYAGRLTFRGRHYAHAVINAGRHQGVHIDELDRSWLWKNYKYAVFGDDPYLDGGAKSPQTRSKKRR